VSDNPYESPLEPAVEMRRAPRPSARTLHIAWAVVFAINVALPLLLGLPTANDSGRFGIVAAMVLALLAGFYVCANYRRLAQALVAGGALVGVSQLLPALQIFAGILGMAAAESLGLVIDGNDEVQVTITSAVAGLVVTTVTGGALITAAVALGLLLQVFTNESWWGYPLLKNSGENELLHVERDSSTIDASAPPIR